MIRFLALLLALNGGVQAQTWDFGAGQWVDLSHAFSKQTLYWPTANAFEKDTVFEGVTDGGWYYTAYDIRTAEHGGTHMDAPIHFFEGRRTVDQVPPEDLIGPALVIDISQQAAFDPDYQLSASDVQAWEAANGRITEDAIVLVRTGYARHWPNAEKYLGTSRRGAEAVPLLHFPGIHPGAAKIFVQRGVKAVGLDTASLDHGQSADFMAHRILFEADIPGLENVADLSALPPRGALVLALPMKIEGGSGGPLRIVAFVPAR